MAAVSLFRPQLENINPQNGPAIFAFSVLFICLSLSMPAPTDSPFLSQREKCKAVIMHMTTSIRLIRGIHDVSLPSVPHFQESLFHQLLLIEKTGHKEPLTFDAEVVIRLIEQSVDTDPALAPLKDGYTAVLQRLRDCNPRGDEKTEQTAIVLVWPVTLPPFFFEDIERMRPVALAILAFFGTLLHRVSREWWIDDRGKKCVVPLNDTTSLYSLNLTYGGAAGGYYSSTADMRTLGRAILSSTLLPAPLTRRWMKPHTFTANSAMLVGAPWEIYKAPLAERDVWMYTKGGDVGAYSTNFALLPDYGIGFTVLAAGGDPHQVTTIVSDIVAAIGVSAFQKAAKEEAEIVYAGTYHGIDSGTAANESDILVLTVDSNPGLLVSSWSINGTDIISAFRAVGYQVRLNPSGLVSKKGTKEGWRVVLTEEPAVDGAFVEECVNWFDVAGMVFGGVGLDEFVISLSEDRTKAVGVEARGWRVGWWRLSGGRWLSRRGWWRLGGRYCRALCRRGRRHSHRWLWPLDHRALCAVVRQDPRHVRVGGQALRVVGAGRDAGGCHFPSGDGGERRGAEEVEDEAPAVAVGAHVGQLLEERGAAGDGGVGDGAVDVGVLSRDGDAAGAVGGGVLRGSVRAGLGGGQAEPDAAAGVGVTLDGLEVEDEVGPDEVVADLRPERASGVIPDAQVPALVLAHVLEGELEGVRVGDGDVRGLGRAERGVPSRSRGEGVGEGDGDDSGGGEGAQRRGEEVGGEEHDG
ncbi:hypothetical protein V500_02107 [Pseudogymnoascus sp. VKM F-4518 (FW-2643)]|nr:hypothetical protein V500_02107 [Pseudogymnoascus sp. VKM F-4518 (FW-2643)]